MFFETLKQISEEGLDHSEENLIDNVFEKKIREYRNYNSDIRKRTNNNRLILLLDDKYHSDVIADQLEQNFPQFKKSVMEKNGKYIKNEIFGKIKYTRMLATGNFGK